MLGRVIIACVAISTIATQASAQTCSDLSAAASAVTSATDEINSFAYAVKADEAYQQRYQCYNGGGYPGSPQPTTPDQFYTCEEEYEKTMTELNSELSRLDTELGFAVAELNRLTAILGSPCA